jgi:branched-subunit amino acid transport protein AzlD
MKLASAVLDTTSVIVCTHLVRTMVIKGTHNIKLMNKLYKHLNATMCSMLLLSCFLFFNRRRAIEFEKYKKKRSNDT